MLLSPILYGGLADGTAPPPGPDARWIGLLALDQPPLAWVHELIIPSTRDILTARLPNRRRVTRIREDATPLTIEVRGAWIDDRSGGPRFQDFSAALLNQQQVGFDLGDGNEYRSVDVLDVIGTRALPFQMDRPPWDGDIWAYVAKVLSYEPYTRTKSPALATSVALGSGAGATVTNLTAVYTGTAPGEPTWQATLVIPSGKHVTAFALTNSTTGETCEVSCVGLTNGTFVLLIDASGAAGPRTPDNNGYGLLTATSPGYGASVNGVDVDFRGNPPTLREKQGQIGPAPVANAIAVTLTADGALTSASLTWLAPTRNQRTG